MADPDAIFFDMDGTLLDWQTGLDESWRQALATACPAHGLDQRALIEAIDLKRRWFWEDRGRAAAGRMNLRLASRTIVREAMSHLALELFDVADAIADDYRDRRDAGLALFPGAIEAVEAVRARGIGTALITNGEAAMQRRSVERFGLERCFDCVIIEGEFGTGKPDERVFHHALDACRATPDGAWMVGDNLEADIVTPHRLGLHTVWIDPGGAGVPATAAVRPHRVIRSIAELLA